MESQPTHLRVMVILHCRFGPFSEVEILYPLASDAALLDGRYNDLGSGTLNVKEGLRSLGECMPATNARRWVPDVLRDAGEDDTVVYTVGVRESLDSECWSLCFMECYDAEYEQNISLGMDTYCLVVDPGQCTVYGGVMECELSDDRLILRLTERAAEKLRTPTEMGFGLALDSTKLEVLRRGLQRVLTSGRANAVPHRLAV